MNWNHRTFSPEYQGISQNFRLEQKVTSLIVPVLLRYSFTADTRPLHIDALGGFTLLHNRANYIYASYPGSQGLIDFSGNASDTSVELTLGPAVRYALSPTLELSATPLVNLNLRSSYSFSNRFSSNFLLGVNYKFGQ